MKALHKLSLALEEAEVPGEGGVKHMVHALKTLRNKDQGTERKTEHNKSLLLKAIANSLITTASLFGYRSFGKTKNEHSLLGSLMKD